MNPRALKAKLKSAGFAPEKPVKHGEFWRNSKGARILVCRPSNFGDPHAVKNTLAQLKRLLRA